MSGQSRLVLSQNAINGGSEEELTQKLQNSNEEALKIKEIPLKHD